MAGLDQLARDFRQGASDFGTRGSRMLRGEPMGGRKKKKKKKAAPAKPAPEGETPLAQLERERLQGQLTSGRLKPGTGRL